MCINETCTKHQLMMKPFKFVNSLVLLLLAIETSLQDTLISEVHSFILDNGYKYVAVIDSLKDDHARLLHRKLINGTAYSKISSLETLKYSFEPPELFKLFLDDSIKRSLNYITNGKVETSLLVLPLTCPDKEIKLVLRQEQSCSFYIACLEENEPVWYQAIGLSSQVALNKLTFYPGTKMIKPSYDLKGMTVSTVSLDWWPYYKLTGCDANGAGCETDGMQPELMGLISEVNNFTVASFTDPDDKWGSWPVNNIFNLSHGIFDGVLGHVVKGKHHVSPSMWAVLRDRFEILDYAVTGQDLQVMVGPTYDGRKVDWSLFIRPFTIRAWKCTMSACLVLIVTCLVFSYYSREDCQDAKRVVFATAWLFFILAQAFFSGALTMFFASENPVPFDNVRDCIKAYPDWILIVLAGNEIYYEPHALSGDPDFQAFWERIQNKQEETVTPDFSSGVDKLLAQQNVVLRGSDGMYREYISSNPYNAEKLRVFGRDSRVQRGIVLTKNSPLTPAFRHAVGLLRDNGQLSQLIRKWEGNVSSSKKNTVDLNSLDILSLGQVVLVFALLGVAFLVCILLLALELICGKRKRNTLIERYTI